MVNKTRRSRKIVLRHSKKRHTMLPISLGIVSMMKDGSVSHPVRRAFRTALASLSTSIGASTNGTTLASLSTSIGASTNGLLNVPITIYKYNTPDLYNIIKNGSETHWFFTGNLPDFVTNDGAPAIDTRIYTIQNKMILFICYSHQLAALNAGATIYTMQEPIHKNIHIKRLVNDPIFTGLPASEEFFAYYTQYIRADEKLPGWKLLAVHDEHVAAMKHGKNIYSMQVHPERRSETYIVLQNWLNMIA
jgi:GMP synthase-like glutamine amidotransferase